MLLLPLPGGAPGGPRGSTRCTPWPGVAALAAFAPVPAVDVAPSGTPEEEQEEGEEPTPEGPPAPRPRPRGGGRGDMPLRWAMAAGHLRRPLYTKQTRVSDHAVYTRGRRSRPCATADTHLAFIGSDVDGACWRRLGAAQSGSPWKCTRQPRTHLGGRPTSIPGRVLGPRGAGGCFQRGGEIWSCVCGRRRRIVAVRCGAVGTAVAEDGDGE